MRKHNNYKKIPKLDANGQPKVKSMLLRTYFTSLLCLTLCVAMFFGTSFAWFTSEVNNQGNEIYIGVLDVELEKEVPGETEKTKWESLSAKNDKGENTTKLFDSAIRWEPGYTSLEKIKVINKGDLAFNYVFSFTDGTVGTTGDTDPSTDVNAIASIAKFFDVWVYPITEKTPEPTDLKEYSDIMKATSGWTNAGTLADILTGKKYVLTGSMDAKDIRSTNVTTANEGTTDGNPLEHQYLIALHMKEEVTAADNLMGKKIGLNVRLVAYQKADEADAFGTYDKDVTVVIDPTSLRNALQAAEGENTNKEILLLHDVTLADLNSTLTMNGGRLDGNNKIVTYAGAKNSAGGSVGVLTTNGGEIVNLNIVGGENGRALYITELKSDLEVSNCTLSGAYAFNLNSSAKTQYTITFNNTTFKNWTSYANAVEKVEFNSCTFEKELRPYATTILTGCTFADQTLDLSKLENDESVTLKDCSYDGKKIEEVIFKKESTGISVSGADAGLVDVNSGVVVLKTNG